MSRFYEAIRTVAGLSAASGGERRPQMTIKFHSESDRHRFIQQIRAEISLDEIQSNEIFRNDYTKPFEYFGVMVTLKLG